MASAVDPISDLERRAAEDLLQRLPALPTAAARLLGLMGNANAGLKEIGNLIGSDSVLTIEVLRMANSAMFGARSEVRSVMQALALLGCEKVKGIACTVALRSYLGNVLQIPALKRCWRHNLATAVVADEIAEWAMADTGDAYTAGLLHDIGRLALIALDPSKYLQLIDRAVHTNSSLLAGERAAYHIDHAAAGARLAKNWGLPEAIQEAIARHHEPISGTRLDIPALVAHACRIADQMDFAAIDNPEPADPLKDFLGRLSEARQAALRIDPAEFQLLVASRVNALES
jgi:putative nucleotidyltransferase with HDIG domain